MKIRRLLVLSILVVLGIFVLTQATYALRDETSDSPNSQKRASDVVDEGNDVLPSNAGIPLTASGYDLTDLTQELRILDDSLNTETTAEVTKLSAEFQISANQGTILDSVIALRSNLDKDENRERAIQHEVLI